MHTDGVLSGSEALVFLKQLLKNGSASARKMFILADSNTSVHCLPLLGQMCELSDYSIQLIEIEAGEKNKNLENLAYIWNRLTDQGAGRDALLLCLGGGMITDLGGFAAASFKRGIDVVHLPTTLLGMVDASIGGKTGIDFEYLKNQIGAYYWPEKVLVFPEFLRTLPYKELLSGFGEVLKYSFLGRHELLNISPSDLLDLKQASNMIDSCAKTKINIVQADPYEKSLRKWLNFGHTVGHAFESYALENSLELLHGEAVAAGMLCELWLSAQLVQMDVAHVHAYEQQYRRIFSPFIFPIEAADDLIQRMGQDKKNRSGKLSFVLVEKPGKLLADVAVSAELVKKSLEFYLASVAISNE